MSMQMQTFQAQYDRICEALKVSTQLELADALGIRQAIISDAKRRNILPGGWLYKLSHVHGVDPLWVLFGDADAPMGGLTVSAA